VITGGCGGIGLATAERLIFPPCFDTNNNVQDARDTSGNSTRDDRSDASHDADSAGEKYCGKIDTAQPAAQVYLLCRPGSASTQAAAKRFSRMPSSATTSVHIVDCDLESQASVRRAAAELMSSLRNHSRAALEKA